MIRRNESHAPLQAVFLGTLLALGRTTAGDDPATRETTVRASTVRASPSGDAVKAAKPGEAAEAGPAAASPLFFLRDGSKVAGFPAFDVLHVETRYGLLKVPATEILSLRFVPRIGNELETEVRRQIERLGSDDFDVREDATDRLRKIGLPALTQVRKAASSEDEETRNRAELLLADIQTKLAESVKDDGDIAPAAGDDDEVLSRRFRIKGRVQEEKYRVTTRYGELEFDVADLIGIDFRVEGKDAASLTVSATRTAPNAWVSTRTTVVKGQRLRITAAGSMQVADYNLTVGPAGTTRYGTGTFGSFPMLALVGQIGKNGKPFLIGASYRGKASAAGTLFIGVVPFRRNLEATGAYKVKIETE
jgi:hypothetical protein